MLIKQRSEYYGHKNIFSSRRLHHKNIHDYNEAIRKGQIFKKERQVKNDLVIAKDKDNEEYAIFYAKDAQKESDSQTKPYEVKNEFGCLSPC